MEILGHSQAHLRATRTSIKWRAFGPEVLPLWVAEMDSSPCPPVVAAVTAALERGDTGYSEGSDLVAAFVAFAQRRWGWPVAPEQVMQVPDVMIGIAELIRAHTPPQGSVALSPPVYDAFHGFVESTGRTAVHAPLGPDLRLDPATLASAFAAAGPGSVYLLCNPQNPTGTVHTADELATLARLADEHGVLVVADEIHAPLVHPGVPFTPYLSVPEASRGMAVVSGSKAWNLAGIKTALAVAGPEADLGLHEVVTHGAQHLAVIAQTAAWNQGEAWLDAVREEIVARRHLLVDLLAEHLPQVRVAPSQASFLAWLDCTDLDLPDPTATFLAGGVALVDGRRYDPAGGAGWVRLNLATSPEVLTEAVHRMAAAMSGPPAGA